MTLDSILYNFQVESQNQNTFLVKWNWKSGINKATYFQISHSFQKANETKTIYSSFVSGNNLSSYTLYNVEPYRVYQVCLKVLIRDFHTAQYQNNSENVAFSNKSSNLKSDKICINSLTKSNHVQAVVSCLIGVVVALLLIALIIILCRLHQHWSKPKSIKTELKGSNRDYYERHRNSETTPTDDFSGFDECESSCTSQMIAEGLAWSPNSSMNSQLNLNIFRSKSNLYNHSSSYPSSTPKIMEEDPFYEAFGEKVPEAHDADTHAQLNAARNPESTVTQTIVSPFFGAASNSTLNSNSNEIFGTNFPTDSIIINNHLGFEAEKTLSNMYLNESSNSDLVLQLIDEV